MGPAAQLARERAVGDLDHPHGVAVLLAEQGHRAEPAGLVERGQRAPHRMVGEHPPRHAVLDEAQVVLVEALPVGEVEAQLVGPDVGAGLADVAAEALAQRGVQQVRGGVVGGRGAAGGGVDPREHPLALVQLARLGLEDERLVVAEAHDVDHGGAAVAALALDHAAVGDLAAAGGVERGLDELGQDEPVLARDGADGRRLLDGLVAGEGRLEARALGEAADALAAGVALGALAGIAGADALRVHEPLEARLVDPQPLLGGQLEREVEREAVRVVQLEGLVGADALGAPLAGARDVLVEDPRALLDRPPERLLLGREPHVDRLGVLEELRVGAAHQLAHAAGERGQEAGRDADPPPLDDRPAHDPPQHVAAILVGRHDAVGEQERHPARVVGEDPQRAVDVGPGAVAAAAELLPQLDQRAELVGLEHRRRALQDRRETVEAEAGVDVLGGQRRERPGRVLVELHEDEVPVLEEALVLAAREVVGGAEVEAAVEVELRARPARPGRAGLPEVLRAREQDDPLAGDADREPRLDRLVVGAEAELVVALEDRDPDPLGFEPEALERQLPRELDGAGLEVVAHREVAEHLEEREVPVGQPDAVDVDRPEALLARRQPVVRRALLPQEVRLERVHPRADEQRRRVVARGHERRRGQAPVVALLEEGEEALADLGGLHARESRGAWAYVAAATSEIGGRELDQLGN